VIRLDQVNDTIREAVGKVSAGRGIKQAEGLWMFADLRDEPFHFDIKPCTQFGADLLVIIDAREQFAPGFRVDDTVQRPARSRASAKASSSGMP